MPYLRADDVVFLAVAGSGVDRAGALLQRDVIGQDAERVPLEERMPEDRAFQLRALERREHLRIHPSPTLSAVACSRSRATM